MAYHDASSNDHVLSIAVEGLLEELETQAMEERVGKLVGLRVMVKSVGNQYVAVPKDLAQGASGECEAVLERFGCEGLTGTVELSRKDRGGTPEEERAGPWFDKVIEDIFQGWWLHRDFLDASGSVMRRISLGKEENACNRSRKRQRLSMSETDDVLEKDDDHSALEVDLRRRFGTDPRVLKEAACMSFA